MQGNCGPRGQRVEAARHPKFHSRAPLAGKLCICCTIKCWRSNFSTSYCIKTQSRVLVAIVEYCLLRALWDPILPGAVDNLDQILERLAGRFSVRAATTRVYQRINYCDKLSPSNATQFRLMIEVCGLLANAPFVGPNSVGCGG